MVSSILRFGVTRIQIRRPFSLPQAIQMIAKLTISRSTKAVAKITVHAVNSQYPDSQDTGTVSAITLSGR